MIRWALIAAGVSGALAVVLGAVGAHAVDTAQAADRFETAARYHLLHSVALVGLALAPAAGARPGPCAAAGVLWLAGIVVFCGSLYALALFDLPRVAAVTPVGGLAFIGGWLLLVAAAWPSRRRP